MTLGEAQSELALVNAAISAILSGTVSSYSTDGRSATKLSLSDLRAHRAELQAQIARLSGGMFAVAQFRTPE